MRNLIILPLVLLGLLVSACKTTTDVATLNVADAKNATVAIDSHDIYLLKIYEKQGLELAPITDKIDGKLYKPQGTGPFPAIVIMHGCGGVSHAQTSWATWLRDHGVVALVVDGFGPRGYKSICENLYYTKMTPSKRMSDAYAGAKLLAGLPFVDKSKIGLMGMSNGASTTLKAMHEKSNELLGESTPKFAFAIPLYPECAGSQGFRVGPSYAPVMVLIGENDDWTLAETCQRAVVKSQEHAIPADIRIYPGAHHSFDGNVDVFIRNAKNRNKPSGFGATIAASGSATESARADTQAFLKKLGVIN